MTTRNSKGTIALGSFTATVALLAGLSNAQAQSAPGAGSFPQSFLIPGTNTSLSIYGTVQTSFRDNLGGNHTSDAGPTPGAAANPFPTGTLSLQGPGAAVGGTTAGQNEIHGGLRGNAATTIFTIETRTPSNLGEIKTVMTTDFNLLASQGNYSASTTNQSINPKQGSGNTDVPRLRWAYGTLGPWLVGQYNSAYADASLYPDITDAGLDPGYVNTANVRQPQVRYTYLAGNGITLSASIEYQESGTLYISPGTVATALMTSAAISQVTSDNTDISGIVNLPSFNTGVAWDQPWGHLMARVGVSRNEIRNTLLGTQILGVSTAGSTPFSNNIKKWGWAIEGGGYLNTWGQDQWKFIVNYSDGISNYQSDLSAVPNAGNMFCNGFTGTCKLISELGIATNYIHRFNPNWRSTAAVGMGFFSKPSNAGGLTNCTFVSAAATPPGSGCSASNTTAAQLASFEKRHLDAQFNVVYSPVPGLTDIYLEWDHWNRWVQASNTTGVSEAVSIGMNFYW